MQYRHGICAATASRSAPWSAAELGLGIELKTLHLRARSKGDRQGASRAAPAPPEMWPAFARGSRPLADQEFLDLIDDAIDVARPDRMVAPWQLDQAGAADFLGELAPGRRRDTGVLGAMNDQCGGRDRAKPRCARASAAAAVGPGDIPSSRAR
jgi:hypothetical protein